MSLKQLVDKIHHKGWWSGSNDECLLSKCETLSSNPSTAKEKKKITS
jgi:hypothetical protein